MQSEKEKSAHEAYKKFLDIMLYDVPLKQLDDLVVNDVTGYGTTLDEKILEIERLRKLVIDQREQGAGYEMNFVINPVHRRINPDNGLAVFIDEIEISMNINGNKNIIPLRFSSVLELTNNSWKVVHLHGSVAVNTEGDTWHKEEHLRKIEELEKLVSEKTEDLLTKNRELEIEASLERVRTVAMGMNKSDDLLNICEVSFKEFRKLGFDNIRNALIHIQYDEQKYFMDYDFSDLTGGAITKIEYGSHPVVEDYLKQIRSAKDAFYQGVIKEDQLEEWKNFRRNSGQIDDPRLDKATALYYYFFSIGIGDIGISTLEPINESQIKILKRFRNVFDLAYRRYTDITRAEAQAREAQIEAALEKVRAVALSLKKSDEMLDIAEVLYEQLLELGFTNIRNAIIDIHNESDETFWDYDYSHDMGKTVTLMSYHDDPIIEKQVRQIESSSDAFFELILEGQELQDLIDMRLRNGEKEDPRLRQIEQLTYNLYSFGNGAIGISNFGLLSDEQKIVLKRFRNVFAFAYKRYNDLVLAETQAREAQIELALERVRARTMAMQSSNELKEVVVNMFDGLKSLGVDPTVCNISLIDKKTSDSDVWSAHQTDNGLITYRVFISHFEHPFRKKLIDSFLNKISFSIHELSGDLKKSYIQYLIDHVDYSKVPDEVTKSNEKLVNIEEGIVLSAAYMKYGLLIVSRSHAISNDESDILQRFAKIFEQTYTRFLDLKKAEAQAREAQIELALERVRARTMAMQQSDELSETARVLFQQFKELGEDPDQLSIGIVNESEKVIEIWLSLQGNIMNRMFKAPIDEPTVINKIYTAWREKRKSVIIDISGDELERYNRYVNSDVDFKEYNDIKNITGREEHRRIIYTALFSKGLLSVATQEPRSEETIKILERFAGVFDGTYTRFLDLQKAEAQAREAQIEAALERVRAASMAMHQTEDIGSVVQVYFEQLKHLDIPFEQAWITILKLEEGYFDTWFSPIDGIYDMPTHFKMPSAPFEDTAIKNWKSGVPFSYLSLKTKSEVDQFLFACDEMTNSKYFSHIQKKLKMESLEFLEARHKFGFLSKTTLETPAKEDEDILMRFASVFEQTYTRFLDIQKAEAQAREAQIETALERVRARSMAMHQTDELNDVLCVLLEQFDFLGINPVLTHLTLFDEANEKFSLRLTTSPTSRILVEQIIDIYAVESWKASFENWKKGVPNTVDCIDYPPEVLPAVWEVLSEVMNALPEGHKINPDDFPDGLFTTQGHFKFGYLGFNHRRKATAEEKTLVSRFATEFGRAYQRFLDIQKAEAQAKEAQIEAALEKVRSQSLAMHSTSEMQLVANEVCNQLRGLGLELDAVGMSGTIHLVEGYDVWLGGADAKKPLRIPFNDDTQVQREYNEVLKTRPDLFAKTYTGKVKKEYLEKLLSHGEFPEELKHKMINAVAFSTTLALTKNSGIQIVRYTPEPYTEAENEILKRFAKVFEQAYIRFMDLQKAEAQTREAHIELSLERIRAQVTAMRESSELLDIVVTMRSEFVALGHEAHYFWHMRWLPDKYEKAMTSGDGARIGMVMTLPRHIHGDIKLVADWEKSDEPSVVLAMDVETAVDYVEKMITLGDFQQVDPQAPTLDDIRHIGGLTFVMARTTHGEIGFSLPGTVPNPPEESVTTLARFAGVFDLAYRRFEDLKEAEEKNKIIQADNERKTKELEDARQLQLSMLPKELPQLPNLDIAVYMKTATEVGGDYYDFNVDANGTLTVLVGDATGHGMMSGMMVSIMKSFFISNKANIELKQFFENSNNSIKDMQLGRLMMGLIGIQITTEKLIATNAGMPSLLYFRNKSQKAGEFVSNNLPLGGMKGTKYLLKAVRYEKGDTLLLMSDGFAELKNSQNEQFGYVRIKEIFRSLVQKSSSGIIEELKTAASQWTNEAEPDDDITFVVIKFK